MIKTVAKVELPVNENLIIRKNRIRSGTSDKRISFVTGIHGDELEGQYCAFELGRILNANLDLLDGIVDIYPGMNPMGIDSITRGIPYFDLDMNRIFPGNDEGDMNEHLASCIVSDLDGSDLVIDVHASNIFLTEVPQIRINELHCSRLLPIAMKANVDLVWVHSNATVLESTLAYSLNSKGVNTLVVEMGVGMRITKSLGDQLVAGVLNLMRTMDMWHGDISPVRKPIVCNREVTFLNSPCSGIFVKALDVGSNVKRGQSIGCIVNPLTSEVLDDLKSPVDGWLFTIREYPVVDQGSLVGRIFEMGDL